MLGLCGPTWTVQRRSSLKSVLASVQDTCYRAPSGKEPGITRYHVLLGASNEIRGKTHKVPAVAVESGSCPAPVSLILSESSSR